MPANEKKDRGHPAPTATELLPPPIILRFRAAPDAPLELRQGVDALNAAMTGLEHVQQWAQTTSSTLADDPEGTIPQLTDAVLVSQSSLIDGIYYTMWDIHGGKPNGNEKAEQARSFLLSLRENEYPQNISIMEVQTPQDLFTMARSIRHACHDLKNDIATVSTTLSLANIRSVAQTALILQKEFSQLESAIAVLSADLLQEYPKEKIPLYAVYQTIEEWFRITLRAHGVSFQLPDSEKARGSIFYSLARLESLIVDIAQNAQRSGATEIIVTSKQQTIDGIKYRIIMFDNNGDDPDEIIVSQGFGDGVSRHKRIQGTGTAMAYHRQVLIDHYGGDLTLEYRTDAQGNRIPGARVRLRLPITSKHPTA